MQKGRSFFAVLLAVAAVTVLTVSVAQAQVETIYLAGSKVITIRDKGDFANLAERAKSIDKAITEVISTQDTLHPKVTIKEANGLWTVYAGPVKVAAVYPAEAKANNVPAKSLAAVWARNLTTALPKATPCSKLPASAFGPKVSAPVTTAPKPAGTASKPTITPAPSAEVAGTPSAVAPVTPVETTTFPSATVTAETPAVAPVAIGAPLLLVREAFNTVRVLSEEEFTAKRDELASSLISDLTPFITGRVPTVAGAPATAAPTAPAVPVETPVEGVEPAVAPVAPVATPTAEPAAAPATTEPAAAPAAEAPRTASFVGTGPAAVDLPKVKEGDPSYAKVPQKNRIREKLEKAREPYTALEKEDPTAAKPVQGLLSACRAAYAANRFDQAEQYVDSALALMGLK